jgi:plastocyanin
LTLVGSIRADVSKRPFALVAGLAILAAACSSVPTATTIDYGSGPRFVQMVADTLDDVGLGSSVALDGSGLPFVTYFGFPAEVKASAIPVPRPIGTPFLPGVLLTTVDDQGTWTQGAIEQNKPAAVPAGITVPFGPVTTSNFKIAADDTNGTATAVASDGTIHAAWTQADGVYYGTTTPDGPASVAQVYDYGSKVSVAGPISAPGIALDGDGNPWVAFAVLGASGLEVHAASLQGSKWTDHVVANEPACPDCPEPGPTGIGFLRGNPVVLFGDPVKHEVDAATRQGSKWVVESVEANTDGLGLSTTVVGDTLYASYYTGKGTVDVATLNDHAPTTREAGQAANPDSNSTGNDTARTAVTAQGDGTIYVAWDNGDSGVSYVQSDQEGNTFQPVKTTPSATSGAHPALAASDDGVYISWYDTVTQDLMVGVYADVANLIVANPQPSITPGAASGPAACAKSKTVQLDIAAQNTAFDPTCMIAPASKGFTINFDNKDSVAATGDHNIGIYDQAGGKELFRGDPVSGPKQVPYNVDALDAGTYYFQCDFHPLQMSGTLQVVSGAS